MARKHKVTTEPVKDEYGDITWTASCSCGKWTAAGPTEISVMVAHYAHTLRIEKPIHPMVHAILQAKQGRGE